MTNIFSKKLIVSILALYVTTFSAVGVYAQSKSQKVIVGYYENEVFQEGAQYGEIKKGYAYEYYRKISEYTGWEYEYRYGTFSSLYKLLEEGKIDLLAGLAYTPQRAATISYANLPMGSTRYYLLKKNSNPVITTNPSSLNGKKLGVFNSMMVQVLKDWISNNGVTATIRVYDDNKKLFEDFDNEELDSIIVEGTGTYGRDDSQAFLCVGTSDYYLCVSKNRSDLLAELNAAHNQLISNSPYFINLLYNKYYSKSVSSVAFSEGETEYIKNNKIITIGYLDNYLPYCNKDKNGNLTGLLKDMMSEETLMLGISDKIKFQYKCYESFSDLIKALHQNEIEAAFPVGGGLYFSEENGFFQSKPVINASVAIVFSGDFNKDKTPVFAVNKKNDMQYYYVKTNYPDAIFSYYDSVEDCLEAIVKQEADFTTINGLRVNRLLKNSRFNSLKYQLLAQGDERCFGVKIGNENLLHLLNRGISIIGEQHILNLAYPYSDPLFKYSFTDYLKNILYVLIPILLLTVIIIYVHSIKSKKKLQILNKKLKDSLENREKFIADMIRYASSEDDADKILNQLVEYIGQNAVADRVYIFEENKNHSYDNTYEWCKNGISREKDNLQNIPYEGVLEVWINEFKKHGQVTVKNLEAYKEVSEAIYDVLKPQNIQTLVAVPLRIRGKIIGFLGIDNPPESEIKKVAEFLKLVEFFFSLMIRLRNVMTTLHENAVHDQLTGCKNRKALIWAYDNNYDRTNSIAIAAVDLNGLKQINDNNGHEAGDKFITRIANSLCDIFGSENVYRIGGDEFIAVCLGKTTEQFKSLMETFDVIIGSTASVGYVFRENGNDDFSELLKQADSNMYQAKENFYKEKNK